MTSIDEHFRNVFQIPAKPSNSNGVNNTYSDFQSNESFIPSKAFIGSKTGYYFSAGSKGLGYYLDRRQPSPHSVVEPKKRKLDDYINTNDNLEADNDDDMEDPRGAITRDNDDIDKLLEDAEKSGLTQLDTNSLKQMLLSFEKKINKNQKLRMKYPGDPNKFMESEIELHDQIQELYAIAAYPELYIDVVENGSMPSILGMITHENTDISISTIGLLQELLEADTIQEDPQAIILMDEFVKNQGLELITQNLERLDELNEEDAQGVYNTLSIIENLVDSDPSLATTIGSSTHIFTYLLNRIRKKEMDANKLYASEILSILLQSSKKNRLFVGELMIKSAISSPSSSSSSSGSDDCNGLDALLQAIAPYRKRDPPSSDELEMLDNLFLSLFSMLLEGPNQAKFIDMEGFELMIRCIKEKKHAAGRAIKALNYAIMKNMTCCMKLIDIGGLKYVFPIYMGRGLPDDIEKKKSTHSDRLEVEYVMISMLYYICIQFLSVSITINGSNMMNSRSYLKIDHATLHDDQQRYIGKFMENDHEKIEKTLELYIKYRKHMIEIESSIQDLIENHDEDEDELDEDDILARRIEGGLLHIQELAIIIAFVCMIDEKILNMVDMKLAEHGWNILDVYSYIEENVAIVEDNLSEAKKLVEDVDTTISEDSIAEDELMVARISLVKEKFMKVLIDSKKVDVEDDETSADS